MRFTEALHTYLAVDDITQVRVEGLDGVSYIDKTCEQHLTQQGPLYIKTETDNVYLDHPHSLLLVDGKRRIPLDKSGSQSTVIFNPWIDKARRMADMPDEHYQKMLCIEAANALDNTVIVEPGQHHRIAQRIG